MTESSVCCSKVENGIEKYDKESAVPNQKRLPQSRPTAIPRLSSAITTGASQAGNTNGKNNKLKIPFSPSSNKPHRPKSVGSYIKSPSQESGTFSAFVTSPTYCKRSSRDAYVVQDSLAVDVRLRSNAKSLNRYDRAISEENQGRKRESMESSFSEKTNNSGSAGGNSQAITSKIGSLANSRHRPGGGNVKIFDKKLEFANVEAKCGSKKNIKYKPGGGAVEIVNQKLEFNKKAQSKVNSLKNIEHQPCGGDVKIDNLKLEWNVTSKVGSLANIKHKACGGKVQIVNEPLPWLKYNKPNLAPEEIAKINKKTIKDGSREGLHTVSQSCSNSICSDRSN